MKKPNLYLGETPVHGINVHSTKDQVGIDTSDATATEVDVLDGKTFYAQNEQKTGTIVSKGQNDLQVNGPKITTPAGYYPTNVSKEVATVTTLNAPVITIDSKEKKIKATYTQQDSGYVIKETEAIGTKNINIQEETCWGLDFDNKQEIKLLDTNTYLTGAQKIERDSNLIGSNIRSGVTIYGVPGTLESGRTVETGTFYTDLNTAYTTISVSCSFIPSYFFLFYNGSSDFEYAQNLSLTIGQSGNWGYGFSYDGNYIYMSFPSSTNSGFGLAVQALPVTVTQNGSTLTFSNIGGTFPYGIMGIGKNYQWVAIK